MQGILCDYGSVNLLKLLTLPSSLGNAIARHRSEKAQVACKLAQCEAKSGNLPTAFLDDHCMIANRVNSDQSKLS